MKKCLAVMISAMLFGCSTTPDSISVHSESYLENYANELAFSTDVNPNASKTKIVVPFDNRLVELKQPVTPVKKPSVTKSASPAKMTSSTMKKGSSSSSMNNSLKTTSAVGGVAEISSTSTSGMASTMPTGYLIQVISFSTQSEARRFVQSLSGKGSAWVNPKKVNGKDYYSVLVGDYASVQDAKKAINSFPAKVQDLNPIVKSINSIKGSAYPVLEKIQ